MNIFYLFLLLCVIFSKDIQCKELQVTTTPDNLGNVVYNGKYNEKWADSQYVSYSNTEKIRFFVSGLLGNSNFNLSHSAESSVLEEKWLYTKLFSNFVTEEKIWYLEAVQECLPRDSWRSINITLYIDDCELSIKWYKNCGNPTRVLSSFNLGFGQYRSELIKDGIVKTEFNSLSAGEIRNYKNSSKQIYFWSSLKDYLFVDINLTYFITYRSDIRKNSISQFKSLNNNTQLFEIEKSCDEPGIKKVYISIELINLQTFLLAFSYKCASSQSSYSFFKIIAILVIIILIISSLTVLILRLKDNPAFFRVSSAFSSKSSSSYLPDKEFPDIQFSDLTFRSDSQAYGTV